MSGEAAQQVLDTSVDMTGLSIVSSLMTPEALRNGAMYNPVALAAGVPVWFHPLQTGHYTAVFRSHWINATVGTVGPQSYSDHTEAGSCWVKVDPPTGGTVALGAIPTRRPGELTINGAASRYDFLFTVGSLDGVAIVQHHRVSPAGMLLAGEELLPIVGGSVTFDKGCYYQGDYLVVLGTDFEGKVYQARRRWARIGATDKTPGFTWEYRGAKGWLTDVDSMETTGLVSVGPVSVAKVRDRLVMSVVSYAPGDDPDFTGDGLLGATLITDGSRNRTTDTHPIADDYAAQVYVARSLDTHGDWKRSGGSVPLGTPDSYLGGGLYFQGQLNVNPAHASPEFKTAKIPYVVSTRLDTGAERSIDTAWGLWSTASTV